jgi:hypothetical protein
MSATKNRSALIQIVFVLALTVLPVAGTSARADEQPKLILQITVDALRGGRTAD